MHRNAEITWEQTMMQAVGEDGPKSVVEAIDTIKAERDTAWRELREIREAISANPEESTADEVRRFVVERDALAAQVEVLSTWLKVCASLVNQDAGTAVDWLIENHVDMERAAETTPSACLAHVRAEEFADGGLAQKAFWEGFERGTFSHNKNIRAHWSEWSEFKMAERIRQEVK